MDRVVEPFDGMALGPGTPAGWTFSFGGGTVFAHATPPGGAFPAHQWYRATLSGGSLGTPDFLGGGLGPIDITCWFGWRDYRGSATGPIFPEFILYLPLPGYNAAAPFSQPDKILPFFKMRGEQDGSITLLTVNGVIAGTYNTGAIGTDKFYSFYEWYFTQLNITLALDGGNFIQVDVKLNIEGETVAQGTQTTTVNVASLDLFRFCAAQFAGDLILDLTQFEVVDRVALNAYPRPVTPRFLRATQGVIEMARFPTESLARISQGVVELSKLPTNHKLRITQGVIEIARRAGTPPPPTARWYVTES